MKAPTQYLILDYETRSTQPLALTGGFEYGVHASTEMLCVAWRLGTRASLPHAKTHAWCPRIGRGSPEKLIAALKNPAVKVVAHNAFFEQVITHFVLDKHIDTKLPPLPISRWICTATLAASHSLPRNLEEACEVLELPVQKDKRGKLLIQRHCKPRKPSKKNPSIWNDCPDGLGELTDYCAVDVDAETHLFLKLPGLIPFERKLWLLDQKINRRGIHTDRKLVKLIMRMIAEESEHLTNELKDITGHAITSGGQLARITKWLAKQDVFLPNMQAKTIENAIAEGLVSGTAKRVIEIRQALSKTSLGKYPAFELRTRYDGRLRDMLLYWAAHTGRFGGRGVQPHNFPRGKLKDMLEAIEMILEADLPWLRAFYPDVMEVFSSCLRGMLTASPKHELFCADFNAIESRVLFWLAAHAKGLAAYRANEDLYREMAALIYACEIAHISDAQREVGKRAILGCGFGMGWKKFQQSCKDQYGIIVPAALAKRAVKAYRHKHKPVVTLWDNLERAATAAIKNPGKKYTVNRTKWFCERGWLFCELPSGRRLAYFKPHLKQMKTSWGSTKETICYFGREKNHWGRQKTYGGKLTENVVQAIARDLMAHSMIEVERFGYKVLLTIHDEILAEQLRGAGSVEEFENIMAGAPAWAVGLPVKVKGWKGHRYRK